MKHPILVLGATGAIGRGVVQAAVEAGRTVIAVSRDAEALADLRSTMARADVLGLSGSVADDPSASALAAAVARLDRPLDGVVATLCRRSGRGRLLDQPAAQLRRALDDILIPHLTAARHLLPLLASAGRSGGYVLVDGPGGEHPWAGYGHRSVAAAALRMLARVLHDEARMLPVRVQMLSVDLPVRSEANAAQACAQWPSAIAIGRRALALLERRDSEGAAPLVHCAQACDDAGSLSFPQGEAATSRSTRGPLPPATSGAIAAPDPDIRAGLLTSRCPQDVRTLLDALGSNVSAIPTKGDSPR